MKLIYRSFRSILIQKEDVGCNKKKTKGFIALFILRQIGKTLFLFIDLRICFSSFISWQKNGRFITRNCRKNLYRNYYYEIVSPKMPINLNVFCKNCLYIPVRTNYTKLRACIGCGQLRYINQLWIGFCIKNTIKIYILINVSIHYFSITW